MAGSAKEFGLKLKQALETIKAKTGRSLADIKDDIGDLIGYKAATVNQIQRGRLSIKLDKLERLTRVLVDPKSLDSYTLLVSTGFDRLWFEQFLKHGDYPTKSRARLLEELFPLNESIPSHFSAQSPVPLEFPPLVKVVGRNKELLALQRRLEVDHFAMVTGMPGIGKTALAGALVSMLEHPRERLFWYTLRGQDGLNVIISRLANFLAHHGEPAFFNLLNQGRQPDSMLFDQILLTMSGKGYLLCIDDFHRLKDVEVINQILTPLIQGTKRGDFDLLIVSREMPPGIYPGDTMKSFTVEGLNEVATTELFSQLNQSPSKDIEAVLHQLTQGNPQFLILAATILNKEQNLTSLFKRIGEEVDIERFMMTEVDDNLDDDEQDVMRSLSICMEYPATYPLVEEIADQGNLRKALSNLCHRHLLLTHKDSDTTRYSQHAIIQQFYYGQIRRRDRQAMHDRAAAYYSLEEQDVFKAALHYEKAGQFELAATQLIGENTLPLIYQGYAVAADELLKGLIKQLPKDIEFQSSVNLARGTYLRIQGRYQEAIAAFTAEAQKAELAEQKIGYLNEVARTYRKQAEFDQALEIFQKIMALYRHNPALPMDPKILVGLGWTYDSLGDLEQANHYFQEVWNTHKNSLTTETAADTLLGIGSVQWKTDEIDAAEQNFLESRTLFEQTNNLIGKTQSTNNLGIVYFKQNRLDEAFDCWDEALEISQSIGAMNELLEGYNNVASAYILSEQYSSAVQYLSDALPLAERSQNRQMLSRIYAGLAEAELGRNRLSQATSYLNQASQWATEANHEAEQGIIAYLSAAIALAEKKYEQALQLVADAMSRLEKTHEFDYLTLSQSVQEKAQTGLNISKSS